MGHKTSAVERAQRGAAAYNLVQPPLNPATAAGPTGGQLANVQAAPLYDIKNQPAAEDLDQGSTFGNAVRRAFIGFKNGASQFNVDPTYNPALAGVIGGAKAIGQDQENVVARRIAAMKPYQEAQAAGLKTAAEKQYADPYEATNQNRILDRELQVAREKARLNQEMVTTAAKGLKPSDALAIDKQAKQDVMMRGIDPQSDEYGRAVAARVSELAEQARNLGAGVIKPQMVPQQKPAGKPKASDFVR